MREVTHSSLRRLRLHCRRTGLGVCQEVNLRTMQKGRNEKRARLTLNQKVKSLSHVRLLATPWTAAYQAPLSMGVSRQEYRSGLPVPSPSQPRQPLIFFPSPRFCLSWTFCTNEIRQSVTFCAWLLALKIIMSGFTHVAA